MSTTVASPARTKPITVALVRQAMVEIASRNPGRADRRSVDDLPPRYVEWGRPASLVARVLERLGFSVGQLKALDSEYAPGDLFVPGVRICESRHPALRRLDDNAKALLQWVQDQQDAGREWGRIAYEAFRSRAVWTLPRWDRRRRPWLYEQTS